MRTPVSRSFLGGLDEGAAGVFVFDQSHLIRQAQLLAVAHGGGEGGVRHADNDIGKRPVFFQPGEPPSRLLSHGVDAASLQHAVGTGKIDVFHGAEPVGAFLRIEERFRARCGEFHNLSRRDVAHKPGVDDAESTGFAAHTPAAPSRAADGERTDPVFVPDSVQIFFCQYQKAERALQTAAGGFDFFKQAARSTLDQMQDDLAVAVPRKMLPFSSSSPA